MVIGWGAAGGAGLWATAGPLQVAMMALLRSSASGITLPAELSKVMVGPSTTKLWQFGSSIHLALTPDLA